jgi:3-deoxy-D-manno-octulosonate 8-phosphate phosphatase (KDO 8-P phosphatase)
MTPAAGSAIDTALARSIRLVGFDIDGVMTDGGVYLGAVDGDPHRRVELKRYDIQDGTGIVLLQLAGIHVAIVTGRVSESVRHRAAELKVDDLAQDPDGFKIGGFLEILERRGVAPEHAAYVGDDFPDLPLLRVVGLPVAVGNAVPEVRAECKVQLTREGGRGAVREFIEMLLKARGDWDTAWGRYVETRSGRHAAVPGGSAR